MRGKTVMQQLVNLRALPLTTSVTIKHSRVRWEGHLQPTPLSKVYTLRIDYTPPKRPTVTVIAPELKIPEGRTKLPHVYPGERLCLCYPEQWNPTTLSRGHSCLGRPSGCCTTKSGRSPASGTAAATSPRAAPPDRSSPP